MLPIRDVMEGFVKILKDQKNKTKNLNQKKNITVQSKPVDSSSTALTAQVKAATSALDAIKFKLLTAKVYVDNFNNTVIRIQVPESEAKLIEETLKKNLAEEIKKVFLFHSLNAPMRLQYDENNHAFWDIQVHTQDIEKQQALLEMLVKKKELFYLSTSSINQIKQMPKLYSKKRSDSSIMVSSPAFSKENQPKQVPDKPEVKMQNLNDGKKPKIAAEQLKTLLPGTKKQNINNKIAEGKREKPVLVQPPEVHKGAAQDDTELVKKKAWIENEAAKAEAAKAEAAKAEAAKAEAAKAEAAKAEAAKAEAAKAEEAKAEAAKAEAAKAEEAKAEEAKAEEVKVKNAKDDKLSSEPIIEAKLSSAEKTKKEREEKELMLQQRYQEHAERIKKLFPEGSVKITIKDKEKEIQLSFGNNVKPCEIVRRNLEDYKKIGKNW